MTVSDLLFDQQTPSSLFKTILLQSNQTVDLCRSRCLGALPFFRDSLFLRLDILKFQLQSLLSSARCASRYRSSVARRCCSSWNRRCCSSRTVIARSRSAVEAVDVAAATCCFSAAAAVAVRTRSFSAVAVQRHAPSPLLLRS